MEDIMNLEREDRITRATVLANRLPTPNYERNYQVTYGRMDLVEAMAENLTTDGVADPKDIKALTSTLGDVALGRSDRPVIITNSCAEEIRVEEPIKALARKTLDELNVIDRSRLVDPIVIQRIGGQFVKPRSSMTEIVDGVEVPSYMGDGINGEEAVDRTPDASRLVAGAVQSRDLQEYLTDELGSPVLMAHEALSLPYEAPFLRGGNGGIDKKYLLTAHLPWVGLRTNGLGSPHLGLLSRVKNTTGVKIGNNSDEGHIAGIARTLNPDGIPGKIAFMVRVSDQDRLPTILKAIKSHAPASIVMYDIHGSTAVREDGKKVRSRGNIIGQIEQLSLACGRVGLRLNGLHLETMNVYGRFECVNHDGQTPMKGSVDPRLNPPQTRYVLDKTAKYINQ